MAPIRLDAKCAIVLVVLLLIVQSSTDAASLLAQAAGPDLRSLPVTVLTNLARRACGGMITKHDDIGEAAEVVLPVRVFGELPYLENVGISDAYCRTESGPLSSQNVVFLVGHYVQGGWGYYYKISSQDGELLNAVVCPYKAKCRPLTPIRVENGHKLFADDVRTDFTSLLRTVLERWGGPVDSPAK